MKNSNTKVNVYKAIIYRDIVDINNLATLIDINIKDDTELNKLLWKQEDKCIGKKIADKVFIYENDACDFLRSEFGNTKTIIDNNTLNIVYDKLYIAKYNLNIPDTLNVKIVEGHYTNETRLQEAANILAGFDLIKPYQFSKETSSIEVVPGTQFIDCEVN